MALNANPASEYVRLQIFPRETIRACLKVLEGLDEGPHTINRRELDVAMDTHPALLGSSSCTWPLVLDANSDMARSTRLLVAVAAARLSSSPGPTHRNTLQEYLVSPMEFYVAASEVTVDGGGYLITGDVLELKHPMVTTTTRHTRYVRPAQGKRAMKRVETSQYNDGYLEDDATLQGFRTMVLAAQWKAGLLPHPSLRTPLWHVDRRAKHADVPEAIAHLVTGHLDKDNDAGKIDGKIDASSLLEKKTDRLCISDSEAYKPIGTPSENSPPNQGIPSHGVLKLSYTATLETPTEKVHISINQPTLRGQESKMLDTTKELWGWMASRGCTGKVRLEDVVELAGKMVGKQGDGPLFNA
ncbi:hypothetical protein BU26DRAFT_507526 [Trematosphaeria pertusa]|uniref:Uncharacterized protein n=1 Tax=Trematosphaeria pertusa TaxID=390896 RepID=A0A6A6I7B7_9PLEO|nr:uncharacterized protein BU26DRAFT_507526 [Trematosphaeria pertusa]KAF2245842.1 hypothetical protein BU26DRAFT_507526 [Trematosphaeria pertusa]